MHMSDALISPAVGGVMGVLSAGAAAYSIKQLTQKRPPDHSEQSKVPLMGVMGAFVFALQMINFTIPGTGASGHICGGILLTALLGPWGGFLTMLSILLIQALFFADGGLLALGANVFNLGVISSFLAYPLVYRAFTRKSCSVKRLWAGAVLASVAALQLGAFGVVMETLLSGKTELPFGLFLALMQPVHLAIGLVEGMITAAVLTFVWRARPELLSGEAGTRRQMSMKGILACGVCLTLLAGGVLSWFASANPDGLEWSVFNITGGEEPEAAGPVYDAAEQLQDKTAVLPDYGLKTAVEGKAMENLGKSISSLVGGALIVALTALFALPAYFLRRKKRPKAPC